MERVGASLRGCLRISLAMGEDVAREGCGIDTPLGDQSVVWNDGVEC